ncbi:mucin-5AC-like [Mastomys coucha]|uniref:mucin-5AC-like n=1 Tax=Mastomys coucha TaxID=35658 RepID=UPI001262A19A|nr:mucin-5AC-like [Mastomys coucha]XP_031240450.1 mucin-5AC-like [Mastomys coucha]
MMTTKNIFPDSKPMTGIQTSSEALNPTTKSSTTNKSKGSIFEMRDSVRNLPEQLPENCESSLSNSTNLYHLGLYPVIPRKFLTPRLQTCDPIPKATKICVPKDPLAKLQLTDEAYELRKNLSPALYPLKNTPTVSAMKVPSADTMEAPSEDTMEAPSEDTMEAPSADNMEAPSADNMEAPSADNMEAPSADTMEAPSADTMEVPCSSVVKAPSSVTSKRLSAGAMKPRTKTQDTNQKEQDNENHCFSLDLVLVIPNQSTLGIQHVPIPEATKVTIPGTHVIS